MMYQLVGVLLVAASVACAQAPEVERIFRTRCVACHGAAQQQSGLRLDGRGPALAGGYSGPVILPGDSKQSKLILRVTGAPGMMVMPPAGPRLTPAEVETLAKWIDGGAPWDGSEVTERRPVRHGHWAFQPVTAPAARSVDELVRVQLDKRGLKPSPEASRRTLARRAHLDLTGLPPTPEEMRAFLADTRSDAYERLVDRLLASPHFGERWARPWLDRTRYADSDGYEKDWARPWGWRYRSWVIDAFNNDMPFDRFTIEQIAGDLLPDSGMGARVATGFHRNTLTNREGGIDNKQFHFEATVDRANTVATAWLGLTAGCAQCHDHKYDPISQKNYYQLYAFFEDIDEQDAPAPLPGEIGPWIKNRDEYRGKREALLREYNVPKLQAEWEAQMLEASANPGKRTDWDLAWDCLLKLTEGGHDGERIMRTPLDKRNELDRDVLTNHFVRNYHFAAGNKAWKELKLDELDKKLRALYDSYPQLSLAMTVREKRRSEPYYLRVRGDYRTNGIAVERDTPSVLPPLGAKNPTRLDLARWIVSKDNPLTARVTVNWMWQELFGRGIVRTADDFGTRGDAPSHPELLDWLASRFVEDGWSVKRLVRTIVTSDTYKQSSRVRADDPDGSLLARQSRLRLPAELVRDAALHAAGLLTLDIGGPSVKPPQPAGVAALAYGARNDDSWVESKGLDRYRRGLYIHFQRATPYPLLMNFDAPKSVVAQCRRERSNTALQALNLLNDPVFVEAATALAYRALTDATTEDARVQHLFEHALSRPPSATEIERFRGYKTRMAALYRGDAATAEKLAPAAIADVSRTEAAAWINLASALLNLDEFITRE